MQKYLERKSITKGEEFNDYDSLKSQYKELTLEKFGERLNAHWGTTKGQFDKLKGFSFLDINDNVSIHKLLLKNQKFVSTNNVLNIIWSFKDRFVQKTTVTQPAPQIPTVQTKPKETESYIGLIILVVLQVISVLIIFVLYKKWNESANERYNLGKKLNNKNRTIKKLENEKETLGSSLAKIKSIKEKSLANNKNQPGNSDNYRKPQQTITNQVEPTNKNNSINNKLLFFIAPEEGKFFTIKDGALESSSDHLYQIEFDGKNGLLSINKEASLAFPLNNPDIYLKGACSQLNEKDKSTKSIKVINKGKVTESVGKLVIESPVKIEFTS